MLWSDVMKYLNFISQGNGAAARSYDDLKLSKSKFTNKQTCTHPPIFVTELQDRLGKNNFPRLSL